MTKNAKQSTIPKSHEQYVRETNEKLRKEFDEANKKPESQSEMNER